MADEHQGRVTYRFWQRGGGYDRTLTNAATIANAIDYIHLNPVRDGLCQRPEDWVWSSAQEHLKIRRDFLDMDLDVIPLH